MITSVLTLQRTSCFDPIEKILEKNGFIKISNLHESTWSYKNPNSGIEITLDLKMYYSSQLQSIIQNIESLISESREKLMHFEESSNYFGE